MTKADISKGRYWDKPWSLVDGCTPCSPGCDHCWAAGMRHRFHRHDRFLEGNLTDEKAQFNGNIITRYGHLDIPLKRRAPTVYAVWNDFFHGAIDHSFRCDAYKIMMRTDYKHTYLILTKRADFAAQYAQPFNNIWHGLTVCNQQEADEKIPVFLQVPGKKFLSIEPMLGPVKFMIPSPVRIAANQTSAIANVLYDNQPYFPSKIDAVILGGETGPGARPMHPEWVRSIRDQCAAAGVPFFFKGWGKHIPDLNDCFGEEVVSPYSVLVMYVGRLLDGRTHDDLPWGDTMTKEIEQTAAPAGVASRP